MIFNLQMWGLFLSFLGSLGWLLDTLFMLRIGKKAIYVRSGKTRQAYEHQKTGNIKPVPITKEEIRLIIWLLLITGGFFLQLVGSHS